MIWRVEFASMPNNRQKAPVIMVSAEPTTSGSPRARFWAAAIILSIAIVVCYAPGLRGPFVFDDLHNIVRNPEIAITTLDKSTLLAAVNANEESNLKRPLAYLSFALNHYFAGNFLNTFPYKLTNVLIHLTNTIFIFVLTTLLLSTDRIRHRFETPNGRFTVAFLTTAIWSLHPIQLTSVLYVVQRMTTLAGMLVLSGLILFVYGRQKIAHGKSSTIIVMAFGLVLGLLGIASKENAVLILLFALVIEFTLFNIRDLSEQKRRILYWFYGVTVALPVALMALLLLMYPDFILSAYTGRTFTPVQRLLTEARVLIYYAGLLFFPNPLRFGLFHDDFAISLNMLSPWTTLPSVLTVTTTLVASLVWRRYPLFSFGILWFLAGHLIESTVIGLELIHEHRNYLPSFGLLFSAVGLIYSFLVNRVRVPYKCALAAIVLATLGLSTTYRAILWASEETLIKAQVRHHPTSARSNAMLGELYGRRLNDPEIAALHYGMAATLDPDEMGYSIAREIWRNRTSVNPSRTRFSNSNENKHRDVDQNQLAQGIQQRLLAQPVTAYTQLVLSNAIECVNNQPGVCGSMYDNVVMWCQAMMRNPSIGPNTRQHLLIYLVDLTMAHRDFSTALNSIQAARGLQPYEAIYVLMEADVRVSLGDLHAAEQILKNLLSRKTVLTPTIERSALLLLSSIDRKRRNSAKYDSRSN